MPIVEAVGNTSPLGRGVARNHIESAMDAVVGEVSAECVAIWGRDDISVDQKNEMIAAISNMDEIRRRKLEARARAKREIREMEAAALKAENPDAG